MLLFVSRKTELTQLAEIEKKFVSNYSLPIFTSHSMYSLNICGNTIIMANSWSGYNIIIALS